MPINTPRFDGCGTGGGGGISELTGDVTAGPGSGSQAATVVGLQGSPVSAVAPADGQVLTWNGATWVPGAPAAGGSGGGGQTWFLNGGTAGGPPIVGLPASVKDLDLTAEVAASTITSGALPTGGVYAFVAGFVTDPGEPGLTAIPAGIWDFNIWASSSAPQPNTTIFRVKVYSYDGTAPTLIATGSATPLYDPGTTIQYLASVLVPQTVLTVADRIYVEIEGTGTSAGHTVTISLGGSTPTHTHTTLPSVAGTGIVHVVNGVMQSPASPVDLSGGATEIAGTLPVGNGGTGTGTVPANGELLIGDGTGYTLATLTDGANVSITEGAGSITIDAVPSGAANEIQINSGGTAFGADPNLTFDGVNLTVATGGSTIDLGQGFVTGGPSLTVETMLGGTLTLGNGDNVDLVAAQEIRVNGATGAAGEVLTSNGPGVPPTWQAGGGSGTIGGTIAANEVAFGTGADTIGGSANLTWDNPTSALSIIGDAADCLTVASLIDGPFLAVSPTAYTLTITDPLTPTSSATMGPGDVAVGDGAASGNVQAGLVGVTENGTGNRITLTAPAGLGTLTSEDSATFVPTPLNVVCGELQVNGAPGAAGEVLTSNGPGLAPTWEAPQVLQSVYVAEGADPATANGSPAFPYATISAAMASITDATPTKRYAISVAGGAYNEGVTFNLKPNVFVVGAAVGAVRITATTFGMDASFSAGSGVDNRSGYQNVTLIGACVFDWSAVTSSAGKLYFTSVAFNSAVTLSGYNNGIAQSQFTSCQFFGTFTVSGINVGVFANNVVFANIVLNQHPSLATILSTAGGYCSGTLTATTTVNTFARRISIFARSFWMGAVTVDGPQTYLDHTVDSLPAAGATVLNGATLVSIDTGTGADKNLSNLNFPTAVNNPIIPAASNATNFGDWGFQWFWSFAFLHASTGTDCYLISYPSAFGAETGPGKNVYVYADGAGLAADVSGGIVGLYTSNASGTGASGLIEAETGSSANGDSGNIRFTTGTPSGSGRRGTVVVNSPLTHPYGTIAVAAPTATALRTHPTYLTSQAAITLPAMLAADDGLRIEIVTTVPSVVTPPSGAGNQRAMTANGGSTWIWINGSADWLCISAI